MTVGNGERESTDRAMMARSIDEVIKSWVQGDKGKNLFLLLDMVRFLNLCIKLLKGEMMNIKLVYLLNDRKIGCVHFEIRRKIK